MLYISVQKQAENWNTVAEIVFHAFPYLVADAQIYNTKNFALNLKIKS